MSRFSPDYYMSESWKRLREGKNVQKHDITLLNHELMELKLMYENGYNYEEAHIQTQKKYNYQLELFIWLSKGEK